MYRINDPVELNIFLGEIYSLFGLEPFHPDAVAKQKLIDNPSPYVRQNADGTFQLVEPDHGPSILDGEVQL